MGWVKLHNGHVVIDSQTASALFPDCSHVNVVYYPEKKTMMMASFRDDLFKSLHKSVSLMVKDKNMDGDKAISVEPMIIDNDIDVANTDPAYEADETMKILSIYFK